MTGSFQFGTFLMGLAAVLAPIQGLRADPFDPQRHLRVDELKPGMTGFGKSVFEGTEIATFQAEVVRVIKNFDPKLDVVLVRLSGQNLEHTGIIGGMSGSPVYIKASPDAPAKLIGAVAYGWYFNKDPLCGVQPIEQMLDVGQAVKRIRARKEQAPKAAATHRARIPGTGVGRYTLAGLVDPPVDSAVDPWAGDGELRPLATPIMVAGMSRQALELFRQAVHPLNMVPVAAGDAPAAKRGTAKLEPGSALCVPMITGDLSMAALGTCTEVIGTHVYGFGHAFTQEGAVTLPMASGFVHTVIASLRRSSKLGSALDIQGAIVGDETAAIYGQRDKSAKMFPLEINVDEMGTERNYKYQSIIEEFYTPILSGIVVASSITALSNVPAEHTIRYDIEADFGKVGTFRSSNVTSQQGIGWVMGELAVPLASLMSNQFGRFEVESVKAEVRIEDRASLARIKQANLQEETVKPGQTLDIRLQWEHYRRPPSVQRFQFELPDDIKEGKYSLAVTSASGHLSALRKEKPHLLKFDNQKEFIETFNRVGRIKQNVLYVRLDIKEGGIAVEKEELPDLPGFRRAILAEASRRKTNPYLEPIVKTFELPFVVGGQATLTFTVDKRADQ